MRKSILRCVGRIGPCRTSASGYLCEGVRQHALDPGRQAAVGVPMAVLGGFHGCRQVLAGDGACAVDDGMGGLAQVFPHLGVVLVLSPVPLLVAQVVLADVVGLGEVVLCVVLFLEGAELVAPPALDLAGIALRGQQVAQALGCRCRLRYSPCRCRWSPCRRASYCRPCLRSRRNGFPHGRYPAG